MADSDWRSRAEWWCYDIVLLFIPFAFRLRHRIWCFSSNCRFSTTNKHLPNVSSDQESRISNIAIDYWLNTYYWVHSDDHFASNNQMMSGRRRQRWPVFPTAVTATKMLWSPRCWGVCWFSIHSLNFHWYSPSLIDWLLVYCAMFDPVLGNQLLPRDYDEYGLMFF